MTRVRSLVNQMLRRRSRSTRRCRSSRRRCAAHNAAVLVAPPGAGKTTRVPLVLGGRALGRAARRSSCWNRAGWPPAPPPRAWRTTLGEAVGDTVGYRVRFGSKVSRRTRIEVVTEGVFTRMILDDPALDGVAAVLFDEFHERSLDADLGLALARDVQQGLREDLKLLVMSATIDGARVAKLLGDAPVIESAGRAFPVETRYLGRDPRAPVERQVADAVATALRAEAGSVLAFLPGAGEIRRTETLLRERVGDPAVDIVALYGALEADVQDRAIAPPPPGRRKVVLATSIAETSLTIEGVRIVVDCGLSRVPRYEPDVGLTQLETVRVSRASADQRRGRAGRTEPGICYRLWDEPQTASLEAANRPEILAADLSSFVLDLASLGRRRSRHARLPRSAAAPGADRGQEPARRASAPSTRRPHHRRGPPVAPAAAAAAARAHGGRCRRDGRRPNAAPRSPPCSPSAASAATMSISRHRLDSLQRDRSRRAQEARAMAQRWAEIAEGGGRRRHVSPGANKQELSPGLLLALAYPDRIAKNRGAGGELPAGERPRRQYRGVIGARARAVSGGGRNRRQRGAGPHRAGGRV